MRAATSNPWRPQLRHDLIHRTIEMRDRPMEVIHDPVAGDFFHFDPSEYQLLNLANGTRTIAEINTEINTSSIQSNPDEREPLGLEATREFFSEAAHQSLLVPDSRTDLQNDSQISHQGALQRRRRRNWLSILGVKLPGVSLERILPLVSPWIAWMTKPVPIGVLPWIAVVALLSVLFCWDNWTSDVSRIANQLSTHPWSGNTLAILLAIGFAKVMHELSHAVTCQRLGAECRELGVMLLCGIPCLYVDITHSWLLPKPADRIRVAAAGILAEWWLAMMALCLWLITAPGILHDSGAIVILVCSISTLLINGNPLLRYDGYYILGDWIGITNLSQKSRTAVNRFIAEGEVHDGVFLILFGLASRVYRFFVLTTLFWIVFRMMESWGLGWLVIGFAVVLISGWLWRIVLDFRAPSVSLRFAVLAAVSLVAAISVPLPHWQDTAVVIRPAHATDVFVTDPGYLSESIRYGQVFASDEALIARLIQPRLEYRLAQHNTKRSLVRSRIAVARISRLKNETEAVSIAELEKSLDQIHEQIASLKRQSDRGTFRGRQNKVLFRVPEKSAPARFKATRGFVEGQYLSRGTRLGTLGDQHDRIAIARVPETSASEVRIGQVVTLLLPENGNRAVRGRVTDIRREPFPIESHQIDASGGGVQAPLLGEKGYRVSIDLDLPRRLHLIPYREAQARIELSRQSVWQKWLHFIRKQFA